MKKYRIRENSPLEYAIAFTVSALFVAMMIWAGSTTYLGM